jgi:RND family efflux transporter MFP subunit
MTVRRSRLRLAGALAALAVLAAAGAFARWSRPGRGGVPTALVEKGSFLHRVPAAGNLEAVRATPISVPAGVPGPFRIGWLAADGSRVHQGDVVIRFDPSEIEKKLVDAEDDLREARLKLGKQQVESAAQLDKVERDLELAKVELSSAQQFQKKDDVIFSHHEIIESDIDQGLARQRADHASRTRSTQERLSRTDDALLSIKIRQAEAKIALARLSLQALTVTAPHDGVSILLRNWRGEPTRVGDSVWNGQPLAKIPDLSVMQAEVFVLEADAGGLKAGQQATVVVESAPDKVFGARIARVDSLAKPRIPGSPVQYFAVTLALDRTEPAVMKPGQRVQAELLLESREGALLVPRQALFDEGGKTLVYRLERGARGRAGVFEPVEVKVGPGGPGRVVIESGVAAGDRVALLDPTRREAKAAASGATAPAAPPAQDETP